jgi:hypothetical protein
MRASHQFAQILTVRSTISRQGPQTGGDASPADSEQPFAPVMISTALSITHLKIRLTLGFKVTSVRHQ